nr:hypothetical protein [Tanacetum cinerariifolium]
TLEMYRASNLKCIKTLDKELEELKLENDGLDRKLAGLLKASKNLDNLIESQRSDKVKEGVGYNVVPPTAADLYLSPKKDVGDSRRLFPEIEAFLCWNICPISKIFISLGKFISFDLYCISVTFPPLCSNCKH